MSPVMPRKKTASSHLTARTADRHQLYELAVQQPLLMVDFLERAPLQLGARQPRTIREDFCGTAQLAALWVRSHHTRRAIGVDNDPKIIRYADRHNRRMLGDAADRLELVCDDVLKARPKADAIVSLNFSHFIFKQREQMLAYLKHAHRCLNPGGVLLLDVYGGPGAIAPCVDRREYGDFNYLWEQKSYDPLTSQVTNYIHFEFPDGSRLNRAFTYRWRLWSIIELRELLEEAGFGRLSISFEHPTGFVDAFKMQDAIAWVAFILARK
jgi:SAM-dependent methyltransferase